MGQEIIMPRTTKGSETMNAVVMCGGLGSRMLPLSEKTPKPMLRVMNRPVLDYLLKKQTGCLGTHPPDHAQCFAFRLSHFSPPEEGFFK